MEKLDDKATEIMEKLLDLRIGTIDRSDGA